VRSGRPYVVVDLDPLQYAALNREADERGLSMRTLLRQGVEVMTGVPSQIESRKRLRPRLSPPNGNHLET
jgi:hypothetical protein